MADPRQFAPLDLERAARGRAIRSTARPSRQPSPSPVTVEADLHLSISMPEKAGRERLVRLMDVLVTAGFSVQMEGPRVVAPERPRRVR